MPQPLSPPTSNRIALQAAARLRHRYLRSRPRPPGFLRPPGPVRRAASSAAPRGTADRHHPRADRGQLLQLRHGRLDGGGPVSADPRRAAATERGADRASPGWCGYWSRQASPSPSARRSARWAPITPLPDLRRAGRRPRDSPPARGGARPPGAGSDPGMNPNLPGSPQRRGARRESPCSFGSGPGARDE